MKKTLAAIAIAGVVATPGIALAHNGISTTNKIADIAQEDRKADNLNMADTNQTAETTPTTTTSDQENEAVEVEDVAQAPVDSITASEALTTAQSQFPDKEVVRVQFDHAGGQAVFSVRFADNSRVDVSAADGTITRLRDRTAVSQNQDQEDNSGPGSSHSGHDAEQETHND